MKLTFVLLTATFLNVTASGVSQTVSFSGKNVPFEEVLNAVKKQTGYIFIYTQKVISDAKSVTIKVENAPLQQFLEELLKNQLIQYEMNNKTILLFRKKESIVNLDTKSVALLPPGSVQGRVTNENGEPLIGANITVKGTNQGTSTDMNGYYKVSTVAVGECILVVSNIGYSTKTASVNITENGTAVLNFTLTPSLVNLDQLTVTSTLSARKIRAYPATIAVINQEDLKNRNLNNIANVLEAIPGIIVAPGIEGLNSGSSRLPQGISIRGTSAGAVIKYLVDGIEVIPDILQEIDPNSIENLEILKGPMSSTLYGNGGAGGIISITTKKAKSGKTSVNFKTMFTQYANDYADYKGYTQDYSMNVSGGNEQFNYLLGSAYNLYPTTKLTDINNGIDQKTWSYNAKLEGKIKNISASLALQYGTNKNGYGITTISENKFRASLGLPPSPVYPLQDYRGFSRSFLTSLHLNHIITKNWYQDLTVGYNMLNSLSGNYTQSSAGTYSYSGSSLLKINARYFMFYDHSWTSALKTSITAGFEYNSYDNSATSMILTTPLTNFFTVSTPAIEGSAYFQKSPYSSTGYFAEAVTSYKENLFLTTGIRYDVNPAYGSNVGAYPQPRVGLSYVIESGAFKLKPRVVWGVSSTPPDPLYKVTYTTNIGYANLVSIGNPDIKPQRSVGYELGADIFYGSNYSLNITWYDQRIKDLITGSDFIYDYTTTPVTMSNYHYNIGEAINRGLEVSAKAIYDPFTLSLSYTQTTSKWGETGQAPNSIVYPGAPNWSIPKNSMYARLSYKIPSLLPWSKKGGNISLDWRHNGSAYSLDDVGYSIAGAEWSNLPDPKPPYPDFLSYLVWLKGYSYFNLRADYSIANYATIYVDVQNLLDKQGSVNGQLSSPFPGRRINFGFNINF